MFYIDFWGFSNDPLYLGYNSAEQENPVLCIFNFQEPSRTQKDLEFFEDHFSGIRGAGALEPQEGSPEAHPLVAPPMLSGASDLRSPHFSCHRLRFDLKPSIKRVPATISKVCEAEIENTETEAEPGRLEGETPPESSLVASPPSPTSSSTSPWWRGDSPPLDYGFVAVAWSISLSCAMIV